MIVLDTHALIWWVSGGPLSKAVREAIDRASASRALHASSMTVWEIAVLVKKGRLELTVELAPWIRSLEALPALRFVPVDVDIALASTLLPGSLHPDPADRIIVATARSLDAALVTRDAQLADYPHVETIW